MKTSTLKWMLLWALVFNVQLSVQYFSFVDKIPNGRNIPCPSDGEGCSNGMCLGSGHINSDSVTQACDGTPPLLNKFGMDYSDLGNGWTKEYCMADSDSDGKTNGDELGDPCCIWTIGSTPRRNSNITHPGTNSAINELPSCLLDGAPTIVAAPQVSGTATEVIIQWTPPSSCYCGFRIYRSTENGQFSQVSYSSYSSNSFTDTSVQASTKYTYFIVAENLAGNSTEGVHASITTTLPIVPAPGIPPFLTGATSDSISLKWDVPSDNGDNITSFRVERNGTLVYSGSHNYFTDAGLTPHALYSYRVRPINSFGPGNFSKPAYFKTNAIGAKVPILTNAPTIDDGNKTSLTIRWDPVTLNDSTLLSYKLQYQDNSKPGFVEIYSGSMQAFEIGILSPGITYSFKYFALTTVGISLPSPTLETTTYYCPNDCSGHGVCNSLTLTCTCDTGFSSEDCSASSLSVGVNPSNYSNSVALNSDFMMYWNIIDDQIEIALVGKTEGYVSIGFSDSAKTQTTSEMVLGWVSGGTAYMYQYYDHDQSSIYLNDNQTIISYNGEEVDGVTSVKFIRKLDTGYSRNQPILQGSSNILYAIHPVDPQNKDDILPHKSGISARGWITVDWYTGKVVANNNLKIGHGILMVASTLFFAIAMFRRYFRKFFGKVGMYIHYSFTSTAIVCMICGVLMGIWTKSEKVDSVHTWLGFGVAICSFIYPPLGVLADQKPKNKFFPFYLHAILERVGVYGGIANGALGIRKVDASSYYFMIYVAVFAVIVILHEVGSLILAVKKSDNDEIAEQKKKNRQSKPVFCTITSEMHNSQRGLENIKGVSFMSTSTYSTDLPSSEYDTEMQMYDFKKPLPTAPATNNSAYNSPQMKYEENTYDYNQIETSNVSECEPNTNYYQPQTQHSPNTYVSPSNPPYMSSPDVARYRSPTSPSPLNRNYSTTDVRTRGATTPIPPRHLNPTYSSPVLTSKPLGFKPSPPPRPPQSPFQPRIANVQMHSPQRPLHHTQRGHDSEMEGPLTPPDSPQSSRR